ncbi:DUF2911 domain-containing protein [Zunongwangia sp. F363]|uniref:DUF2911 domain-containing protein n=1 Tax=Autumnicola tepida TaxID=3075595 RepID=A0ABU3CDR3_9FLAO|nr:DUF2911 domain-containing protein [Zunongwangia sp. F363]MDT0644484.1 DUF2911 domain-containing protein [Zunongwangia sp. F363]
MKNFILILMLLCASSSGALAQIETPQPSPSAKIEQKIGLTDVSIEYSRPNMRGREIFGNLVPYNEVWRTGANENTSISFSDDVMINGEKLPKGEYSIYTIPKQGEWEVIFYTTTDNWGLPQEWDENNIALKATARAQQLPFDMETFTIMVDELHNDGATLNFIWANIVAALPFEVPTDAKATASIEKVMSGQPGPNDYFAAASYYHDQKKDMDKAYTWIQKAAEANEGAFWILRRKSLIEAEMGKKEEAIATAKQSLAAAEKAGNKDYVKMNKDSLQEWGAM